MRKYHLGLTQWGFKEWIGNFFNNTAKPGAFLTQYAEVFNSVEGNTTFYNTPDTKIITSWIQQVSPDFKFCFKLPKLITHQKRLIHVEEEIYSFLEVFQPFRQNLGPFHIQLDSRFSFQEIKTLEIFIESLPAHLNFALEVRHPDFFDKGKKENYLNNLLRSYDIDRVVFDTRRLHSLKNNETSVREAQKRKPRTPVRFDTTGSSPFVRYVGANDILNNEAYLKEWAIIVADWIKEGKHPYMFIHAPNTLHAPVLARFFHNELSKLIQIPPLPEFPFERQNKQLGLF